MKMIKLTQVLGDDDDKYPFWINVDRIEAFDERQDKLTDLRACGGSWVVVDTPEEIVALVSGEAPPETINDKLVASTERLTNAGNTLANILRLKEGDKLLTLRLLRSALDCWDEAVKANAKLVNKKG